MTAEAVADPLRERTLQWLGKPLSGSGSSLAPDEVNVPMIRHWVDALDDQNPVYLDADAAAGSRFGGIVAPSGHVADVDDGTAAHRRHPRTRRRGGSHRSGEPAGVSRRGRTHRDVGHELGARVRPLPAPR